MMPQVDFDIGRWIVSDGEGTQAIAIIKDIEAFCIAASNATYSNDLDQAQVEVTSMIDFVEFAVVNLREDGVAEWKAGEFVDADGAKGDLLSNDAERFKNLG